MTDRREDPFAPPRRARATALTVIAFAVLLLVPLIPGALGTEGAGALVGVPVESVAVVLVLLAVVRPPLRVLAAAVFGALVVAALVAASLDLGFGLTIDRPFSLAEDGGALVDAYGVVVDTVGPLGAATTLLLAVAVLAGAGALVAAASLRVARTVGEAGERGRAAVTAVAVVWIVCAASGTQLAPGAPVAASRTGDALVASSARALASVRDQQAFERALASDPLEAEPSARGMAALEGKDVVIAFVESYGRVALEPSEFTGGVAQTLDEGGAALARRGYGARSAFLESPTFGGVSWLAHSTLQSGVWVDSPGKYARLLSGERLTLTRIFEQAGWRTMAVVPSNKRAWAEGERYYGFDTILDSRTMGYRGPAFGYARMPDQYTWSVFHERAGLDGDQPVMAEVDLVSSHTPWTPLPEMVGWADLGRGEVFAAQAADGEPAAVAWTDPEKVRALYAESVEYSLAATFSYLETFDQPDLVLVLLGDHQPARIVSGEDASHDVPVTIIAQDPAVLDAIEGWDWDEGVRPTDSAPVWRMDDFRDRFVDAFSG